MSQILETLLARDEDQRAHFFPVRHYSPTSARLVHQMALELEPAAILIEGPWDYNDQLEELYLEHVLPVALFSYVRYSDNTRASAFYPFCEFSPEWQAILAARELEITPQFIDRPWYELAAESDRRHRYADRQHGDNRYIQRLCERFQVQNFDEVWDVLFELDRDLDLDGYLERAYHFVYQLRYMSGQTCLEDDLREEFMTARIREALAAHPDEPVLVVTGGFHTPALHARLRGLDLEALHAPFEPTRAEGDEAEGDAPEGPPDEARAEESGDDESGDDEGKDDEGAPEEEAPAAARELVDHGITLTPFTYERIDKMSGYQSGLHGPAFYRYVWEARQRGELLDGRDLLYEIVRKLRDKGQLLSTSDAIAVETTAWALASMRGRTEIWRYDLLDALSAAVIKEEQDAEYGHPVLDVARQVFCGSKRGLLGEGTALPPLVRNARRELHRREITPGGDDGTIELELLRPEDRETSMTLHRCRCLGITGFELVHQTDLVGRQDMSNPVEQWEVRWSPEYEASLIENAIYGADLAEAATARLLERARELERDAEQASLIVLDAVLMGLDGSTEELYEQLFEIVRQDPDFFHLTQALDHLLYLYAFDDIFGGAGSENVSAILGEAYRRSLWLFEGLGRVQDRDRELIEAIGALFYTFRRCSHEWFVDSDIFVDLLERVGGDEDAMPLVRGATLGALFSLREADLDRVLEVMAYFADPMDLGDFLIGFFSLAREAAQRDGRLLERLDEMVMGLHTEQFWEVLPGLRLAFTFFTPREKRNLIDLLFPTQAPGDGAPDDALAGLPPIDAMSWEHGRHMAERVLKTIERFGLRGLRDEPALPGPAAEAFDTPQQPPAPGAPPRDHEGAAAPAGGDDAPGDHHGSTALDASPNQAGRRVHDVAETQGDAKPGGASPGGDAALTPEPTLEERMKRWKMVLGVGSEDMPCEMPQSWAQREQLIAYLYDREYGRGRNVRAGSRGQGRGRGRGRGQQAKGRGRQGGAGPSQLTVPDWINGVHELFPKRVIERLERDALDRYEIEELVTRPELLEKAEPNLTLMKAVLRTKHLMDERVLQLARDMVRRVVQELVEKMSRSIQTPFTGSVDRRRRSLLKIAKNFDAHETIRRNLKYYDPGSRKLIIQDPYFFSRIRRRVDRWQLIIVVDQSGSMLDSVIHSSVMASIFWGIKALKTHLVVFDTEVVDLTSECTDPVETLMRVQLGGGTDIARALRYADDLIENPRRTIVLLVTDFYEGGSVTDLLATTRHICDSGATLLGLAALDDRAEPTYDRQLAQRMVDRGAHVGAMTPGELAAWVAERVR